jgi:hypothetical protein
MYRLLDNTRIFLFVGALWLVSANAQSADEGVSAANPDYQVTPIELAGQLAELAAIPDFGLTAETIERIAGIKMEKDESPPTGTQQKNAGRWGFGPDTGHPYGFYLEKSPQLVLFNFAWHEYGRQSLPFQRAPAGMCVPARSLIDTLLHAGWVLKYTLQYRDVPPGGLYFRGERGRLELSFDARTDCLITLKLTSAVFWLN